MYQSVNPYNGEIVQTFETHADDEMWAILAQAIRAYREIWGSADYARRAQIVGEAAGLMEDRSEDLAPP